MFIKKLEYEKLLDKIDKLSKEKQTLQFEMFKLQSNGRYDECTLPNKISEIRFDDVGIEGLMEFMLLAEKKGIDISDIEIKRMHHNEDYLRCVPNWKEVRDKFKAYIN